MVKPRDKGAVARSLDAQMPRAALTAAGLADVLAARYRRATTAAEIDRVEADLGSGAVSFRINRAGFTALLEAKKTVRKIRDQGLGDL